MACLGSTSSIGSGLSRLAPKRCSAWRLDIGNQCEAGLLRILRITLPSPRYAGHYTQPCKNDRPHSNPARRHVHHVGPKYQPYDKHYKTDQVKCKGHSASFGNRVASLGPNRYGDEEIAKILSYCFARTGQRVTDFVFPARDSMSDYPWHVSRDAFVNYGRFDNA